VADLAVAIAGELGLDEYEQTGLRVAGNLHDIGKIAVPSEILTKPGRLSVLEYEVVKTHVAQGYDVLRRVEFSWPVAEAVLQHHERLDGSGYPNGLKGPQISRQGRILAVADVVEAMASHRPYRPGLGVEAALEEINRGAGRLFDAEVVGACNRLFRDRGYSLPGPG
jgi:putative nucleotidyltransferase with HDIG domain